MRHRPVPPADALDDLLSALEADGYVAVKNTNLWHNLERGGDWDLLVLHPTEAERLLVERLGLPHRVTARSYVRSYFYPWGEIDLLPRLEWRGVDLVDPTELVGDAMSHPDGIRAPRPAHEATASWVAPLLWSGTFKERYAEVVNRAAEEDGPELKRVLGRCFSDRWATALWNIAREGRPADATAWTSPLRRDALRRSLRRAPTATLRRAARFRRLELALRLDPPLPALSVATPDEAAAAVRWVIDRQPVVDAIAVVDGAAAPQLAVSKTPDELDELLRRLGQGVVEGEGQRPPTPALRARMAKEQARGRLVVTIGAAGDHESTSHESGTGYRRAPALLGRCVPAGQPEHVAGRLDTHLREHVVRTLRRPPA